MSGLPSTSLATCPRASKLSATPDPWAANIGHIKRLYIDEGYVLDEVIKIMERDYDFYATRKSYKLRLRKFGVRKNVAVQGQDVPQVLQLISRAKKARDSGFDQPEHVRLATGQVVDVARLKAYLRRRKTSADPDDPLPNKKPNPAAAVAVAARDASRTVWPPRGDLPPTITAPDVIRLPELIFAEIKSHVSQRFSIGPVAANEEIVKSNNPYVTQAHGTIEDAANLLAVGKLDDAITLLKVAPRQLEILLAEQELEPPSLQMLIWKTGVSLIASASLSGLESDIETIVKSLFRYLENIARTSRSLSREIRNILTALAALSRIDGPWMYETAFRGILAMLDQQDIALGAFSIYGPLQKHAFRMLCEQKWTAVYNDVTWSNYRKICKTYGEISFEGITALYQLEICKGDKFRRTPEGEEFRLAVHRTLQWADGVEFTEADADHQGRCPQFIETSRTQTVTDLPSFLNMLNVLRNAWGTGQKEAVVTVQEDGV